MLRDLCRLIVWLSVSAGLVVWIGCTTSDESPPAHSGLDATGTTAPATPASASPSPNEQTVSVGIPPLHILSTLRAMVEFHDTVIVAKVTGVSGTRFHDSPSDLLTDPSPAPLSATLFTADVVEVIHSPKVNLGDTITISQSDRETQRLQIGTIYLFFLQDLAPFGAEGFNGLSAARFVVEDGLVKPNGAESYAQGPRDVSGVTKEQYDAEVVPASDPQAALAALKGQTLEEAKQKIVAAIAEAPLPPPLTPFPTPTPTVAAQ